MVPLALVNMEAKALLDINGACVLTTVLGRDGKVSVDIHGSSSLVGSSGAESVVPGLLGREVDVSVDIHGCLLLVANPNVDNTVAGLFDRDNGVSVVFQGWS